jgi:hypothetical protein
MPIKVHEDERVPHGHFQIAPAAVIKCPGNGRIVSFQADGGTIRYRPDNVDPTNLVVGGTEIGMTLTDKEVHTYVVGDGYDLTRFRFLEGTNGSGAKVTVVTYK